MYTLLLPKATPSDIMNLSIDDLIKLAKEGPNKEARNTYGSNRHQTNARAVRTTNITKPPNIIPTATNIKM